MARLSVDSSCGQIELMWIREMSSTPDPVPDARAGPEPLSCEGVPFPPIAHSTYNASVGRVGWHLTADVQGHVGDRIAGQDSIGALGTEVYPGTSIGMTVGRCIR